MAPIDPSALARRARRAYELGRLRFAARLIFVAVPVALFALSLGAPLKQVLGVGGLVTVLGIWLRWRGKTVGPSVLPGVLAGAIPLLVGAAAALGGVDCVELDSWCGALSVLTGVCAGIIVGRTATESRQGYLARWVTCASIALLTSCMSCLGVGAAALIGSATGTMAASIPFVIWRLRKL